MTVELAFRFPLGRVHATPWGENQNQGGVEFPPSPWRLLRALYATWRSRAEELDERLVLELLDQLADPPTFVVPRHALAHTRHYLPGPAHKQGFATDKAKVLDAFVSVAPSDELIIRWDIDLDQPSRDALTTLAERLTYLGRAESICDVSARFEADSSAEHALRQLNDEDTTPSIALLAPHRPVDEASLTVTTTHVRTVLKLREPPATHWLRYPRPVPGPEVQVRNRVAPDVRSVTAIRWSIASGARPSKYEAVAWADALRHAVFSQYGGKDKRQPPSALSGKFSDGSRTNTQHKHVHWLAFGDQNDRRLSTLVAWAPGGFPNADGHSVDEEILDAMANVRFLRSRFIRSTSVGVEGWGRAEDVVPEIAKASHHWVSATPFAPSRHPRKNSGSGVKSFEVAVAQELTWRGHGDNLPSVTFDESGDWHHFRRHRPNRERLNQARRVVGLRLEFPEPFAGPLALGALSHFGLGLFMPIED